MKVLSSVIVLSVVAGLAVGAACADETDLPVTERAFIASKIYAATQLYFAHFQAIPGFDLDAAYKRYLEEALPAAGRKEFDLASMAFVAQLRNGHSGYWDPWLDRNFGGSLGFTAQHVEGKWVVTYSRQNELKVGEVLSTIDGVDVERLFQNNARYISASNERGARTAFFSLRFLFPQKFTLGLADGRSLPLERLTPISLKRKTEGRWLQPATLAYIKIPSFDGAEFQDTALKLLREYQDAAGLIIDLRGNGGGNTPSALIDALMDRPYRQQRAATPLHIAVAKVRAGFFDEIQQDTTAAHDETFGYLAAMKQFGDGVQLVFSSPPIEPTTTLFKGRLLILIDRHVGSAAEDFSIPFKDNHRAMFVGETTGGSTGQPFMYSFPNGIGFRISSKRDAFPDGSTFEGVGIVPDIEVPTTIAALKAGKDPVLEKAIALLGEAKR